MSTILLARHGETDWNRDGRFQGWADPPLNATGRRQAQELAEQLRVTPFDAVYSSDLQRAQETAEILASPHGVPVLIDPGLREIDVGSFSGLTAAEANERFGGIRPDGETREEHGVRVLAAVERIAAANPARRLLIVTHGGTMRALHGHLTDVPLHPIPNCGVLELHVRDERLYLNPS